MLGIQSHLFKALVLPTFTTNCMVFLLINNKSQKNISTTNDKREHTHTHTYVNLAKTKTFFLKKTFVGLERHLQVVT